MIAPKKDSLKSLRERFIVITPMIGSITEFAGGDVSEGRVVSSWGMRFVALQIPGFPTNCRLLIADCRFLESGKS
jgi:hypothetical protein